VDERCGTLQTRFKVAAVDFNPETFEFDRNVKRACAVAEEVAANGAKLIVLPEAALSTRPGWPASGIGLR
jgi:predicted amidohydrolase